MCVGEGAQGSGRIWNHQIVLRIDPTERNNQGTPTCLAWLTGEEMLNLPSVIPFILYTNVPS